jgi:predicted transcriptional regulator
MTYHLFNISKFANALKYFDLCNFLFLLRKKPLTYKEIKKLFNDNEKTFYRRMKMIKEFGIIEKKAITYDSGHIGTQYQLTEQGKKILKMLNEVGLLLQEALRLESNPDIE